MATILREWRGLQRRCHRALLTALRGSDAIDSQNVASAYGRYSDRKQPWLSALYGSIVASKRSREMAVAARISAPSVPVISVGNITFGATGKTPCVMLLTEIALQHSRERKRDTVPMLLTRGYGDDEWRFFQSAFPECKLAIGADRLGVGTEKAREYGAQLSCVVLDDGLQQWRIRKDLEVVMVDALHPFGNGHLIPYGSLRERYRDALARADVVVIHHATLLRSREALDALKHALLACAQSTDRRKPIIATSQMRVKRLVRASDMLTRGLSAPDEDDDDDELKDSVALIVCGVGNPESVELVVCAMDCWQQVQIEAFPDHHSFSRADMSDLQLLVERTRALTQRDVVVVTTEKDFFRTPQLMAELAQSCDLRVLQCELELVENAGLVRQRVHDLLDC